jgi:hypothetical protein
MRKYEVNGSIETLRTLPSEITLNEFTQITQLASDEPRMDYEYYLGMFGILGLSDKFLDIMDIKTLVDIIKDFQEDFVAVNKPVRTIVVEGKEYHSYNEGEEFTLKARDFAKIESRIKEKGKDWVAYAMATIFRKEGLADSEHKAPAHTQYKQVIFSKELKMDICLPYLMLFSTSYLETIKMLAEVK